MPFPINMATAISRSVTNLRNYKRWLFYTLILIYGFQCLWRKPWFWNIRHCWYDYPYHQVRAHLGHNFQ